jgi:hypothetical protein
VQCKVAVFESVAFSCATAVMFLFTAMLAGVSRVYVLRLLRSSGCDMDEMDKFVLDDERADLEDENKEERISYKELKDAVDKIKTSAKVKQITEEYEPPSTPTRATMLWKKSKAIKTAMMITTSKASKAADYAPASPGPISSDASGIIEMCSLDSDAVTADVNHLQSIDVDSSSSAGFAQLGAGRDRTTSKSVLDACSAKRPREDEAEGQGQGSDSSKWHEDRKISAARRDSQVHRMRRVQLLHAGIKSGVFFFDSPALYFLLRNIRLVNVYKCFAVIYVPIFNILLFLFGRSMCNAAIYSFACFSPSTRLPLPPSPL